MIKKDLAYYEWNNGKSYLKANRKNGVLTGYTGNLVHNGVVFLISINVQKSGRYKLRGSVKALDKFGSVMKQEVKKNNNTEIGDEVQNETDDIKYRPISTEINLNSDDYEYVKSMIYNKVIKLYSDYVIPIEMEMNKINRPDSISPATAAAAKAKAFVAMEHKKANSDTQEKYVQRIKNECAKLPALPMSSFKKATIKKYFSSEGIHPDAQKELKRFWQFCIDNRVCIGSNPIESPHIVRKSGDAKQKKLNRITQMSLAQQDEIYAKLKQDPSGVYSGIGLMMSGVSPKAISQLFWKDIVFMPEYDHVVVRLYDDRRAGATHNLSRTLAPQTSIVIRKHYEKLKEKYGKNYTDEQLLNMPVCGQEHCPEKPVGVSRIVDTATKLIEEIFLNPEEMNKVRKIAPSIAAATYVMHETYRHNLEEYCNLDTKSIEYQYLTAGAFGMDVDLDHYIACSYPGAWEHFYTIMRPLCEYTENEHIDNSLTSDGLNTVYSVSDNSREYAKITIEILLDPGQEIKLLVPHGVTGEIKTSLVEKE